MQADSNYRKLGRVIVGALVVGLGVAGFVLGNDQDSEAVRHVHPDGNPLDGILLEIRAKWNPRVRTAFVQRHADRIDQLTPDLLAVLAVPKHAYLKEAIYVANELRVAAAAEALRSLLERAPEDLQANVLRALDRATDLAEAELAGYLHDKRVAVVLAALAIVKERSPAPLVALVIGALGHAEVRVREAALAALPEKLSRTDIRAITELATTGADKPMAIRALGRAAGDRQVEAFLMERLQAATDQRLAALQALCAGNQPLNTPARLWAVAGNGGFGIAERALALQSLERTSSWREVLQVQHALGWDPVLRYFVARCMLRDGKKQGARVLLDVVTESERLPDSKLSEFVLLDSKRILGRLSNTGLMGDLKAWQAWHDRVEIVRPQSLSAFDLSLLVAEANDHH